MSDVQGKLFKVWLNDTGKSPNTASSYRSGPNTISNHLGRLRHHHLQRCGWSHRRLP